MNITTDSCVIRGRHQVGVISQQLNYQGTGTLVRITRGGICGSDLHYYQHGRVGNFTVKMPMIPGHEVTGYVVKSDNPGLAEHQKVAINPAKACGHCKYCAAQQENQCTGMRFFGSAMYFPHVDGGFSQYIIVDSAQCIPFDHQADEKVMVFAEPLAVCLHATYQAGELQGKKVFISGVGPIGCLIAAAAKARGATEVVCTDISPRSLAMAQQMGATLTLNAADGDFSPYLAEKGYFDVSFEASGHPASLIRCLDVTRARGTLVQVGMGDDIPGFPLMTLIAKEIRLTGSFRFTSEFALAVKWLENGTVDPRPLFSGEYHYSAIEAALIFAGDKQQAAKVQLTF
ncbi:MULTISPECIES: L-idonate 5-dehydrogenase [unclassified Tatumella]|uniref:L-idonate 5-dehydrogenase n=1 Tax=unclassified Tatumella TaxID=2649542 RepID=UPI001BAFD4F7|nr:MULTISPECIES: L-idonate 5-dehydrogenase [unclassified Tatumella]MBS0877795.1 L-idonate 5-dehydrogenase [Tatumella sp. JGM82]MBS0891500.1 L-idonate 5-dehydrogenase [Tatumella sp. JGM94]MBS0902430.1 L-idonate 5-dehydrogenase [Tatumella sp. JGM100]